MIMYSLKAEWISDSWRIHTTRTFTQQFYPVGLKGFKPEESGFLICGSLTGNAFKK
jgi:hypothetical protein